jgi:starch synthase (maltosyl-transferring)
MTELPPPPASGLARVVIEGVTPRVDGGRFAAKGILGERIDVEADLVAEGHDLLRGVLQWRGPTRPSWSEVPLEPQVNDRWRASFQSEELGLHEFSIEAWVDRFGTWQRDLRKKVEAGLDVAVELRIGAGLARAAARRAGGEEARRLAALAEELSARGERSATDPSIGLSSELAELCARHPDRSHSTRLDAPLRILVDPPRAAFSSWYEMFPRSCSSDPERKGTLSDCEERLPYVSRMGFDVLYLPPIHPIGKTHRKGRNNALVARPDEPGSPWAIGSADGGHKAVHPELGTLADFERLVRHARELGIEVALDIALQCSPDHPYVAEHPEWFRRRPDGTIQYAENPPKKYQDIIPFDFECRDWQALWLELRSVFEFWIERGVRFFRVDNPHTKPLAFWEWLLGTLKADRRELVFLSEAFTRPKVMYALAKLGFTQSYTYFAWRRTRPELESYMKEITSPPVSDFFRPNLWPNTPDILTDQLQAGGRAVFAGRLVLAATLGANYGIYGPAFEQMESRPLEGGREEYLDSEKYQQRRWDIGREDSLADFIARVNRIRRENHALQRDRHLHFHGCDNDRIILYSKRTDDRSNVVLVAVNLDPHHVHTGWSDLELTELGVEPGETFQVHELLTGARYLWSGARNFLELDSGEVPAQIFRLRHRLRTERDFDYFL